jgi:SAM-dependent methyltransferase
MNSNVLVGSFPEIGAGGYTCIDGTVEFYTRINALLQPDMAVLDFGAGRGAALMDDPCGYRRRLRHLQGKVAKVVACDVDDAVLDNPGADEKHVIEPDAHLPFADQSFDLIIGDFVFEHIQNSALVVAELSRVLKPGGWICARTPNKYGLISLATRVIHNSQHASLLRWAQPGRKARDVFPTSFCLNSRREIAQSFPPETFDNFTYRYEAEPAYVFNNRMVLTTMLVLNRLIPPVMKSGLFVFLRKRTGSGASRSSAPAR